MELPQTITPVELLDIGRALIVQEEFDAGVVLELLDAVSTGVLDVQARGAIQHARLVTLDVFSGNFNQTAIARLALTRVIILVDTRVFDAAIR